MPHHHVSIPPANPHVLLPHLHLPPTAVLGIGCTLLLIIFRKLLGAGVRPVPRVQRADMMTRVERHTITLIERAVPEARVHAQVSLGALLRPPPGLSRGQATTTRNRFSSKRVDFVLEDRATGEILAIIELDDRTHNAANDRWRDTLTAQAGYRTIRLPAGERPTYQNVSARIHAVLGTRGGQLHSSPQNQHRSRIN